MPRFVLLYHDCPPDADRPSHWDLMLESGEVLRTWALDKLPQTWRVAQARTVESYPQCPALADEDIVAALELGNHRRDYLNYEGELSGNRGHVIRVGSGSYSTIAESPTCWQVSLNEDGVASRICLSRTDAAAELWKLAAG